MSQNEAPGAYPPPPPPPGYPTKDALSDQNPVPIQTKSKGDGFWKGCCAALCCCCLLDACF